MAEKIKTPKFNFTINNNTPQPTATPTPTPSLSINIGFNSEGKLSVSSNKDTSAYQQNMYTPTPQQPEQKTFRSTLGQLFQLGKTDPTNAKHGIDILAQNIHNPTSSYYQPYSAPTNNAVNILKEYGINTDDLTDEWFEKNRGSINANLIYDGTSNTPTKPGKKATDAQNVSYWLYQYEKSEAQTKKAEVERQAAIEEARYWTGRTDLNLSDDDVIGRVRQNFASKYPTLAKMEASSPSAPMEFNRAIDFSDDYLYANIWQTRNPEFQGDIYQAMANSYNGEGNVWQYNEEIAKKLDPNDPSFNPYSVSAVGVDDVCVYYGVNSIDDNFIREHEQDAFSQDETKRKMYGKAREAAANADEAEKAAAALEAKVIERLGKYTDYNRAKAKLDSWLESGKITIDGQEIDIRILNKMDASIGKGDSPATGNMVSLGRAINYKYSDMLAKLKDMCDQNLANEDDCDNNLASMSDPTPAAQVMESAEEELQLGPTATGKAESSLAPTPGPGPQTTPGPLAERENEVFNGVTREQTIEEKNNAMMTQRIINVTESLGDRLTEQERKHFGNMPLFNGQALVDAYSAVMSGNVTGPVNMDLLANKEWIASMATKQSVKAEEKYVAKSFESLALRTTFDKTKASAEDKRGQITALETEYGEKILATAEIPEETEEAINPDTNFYVTFAMNGNGEYEPLIDIENPNNFLLNELNTSGLTYDQFRDLVTAKTDELNIRAKSIREAKEKYPELTEEETNALLETDKQIKILKAQLDQDERYIADNQDAYDSALESVREITERRDMIGDITLKDSGYAVDKSISDSVLNFVAQFTGYKKKQATADSLMDDLASVFEQTEDKQLAIEGLQEEISNIDDSIADINFVMTKYGDSLPADYRKSMADYSEWLAQQKLLYESFLMTQEDNYEELVKEGNDFYWGHYNSFTDQFEFEGKTEENKNGWVWMTDSEKNLYYAICASSGIEAADEFYNAIDSSLYERSKEGFQAGADARAQSGFFGRALNEIISISSAPADVVGSLIYFGGVVLNGKGDKWARTTANIGKANSEAVIREVNRIYEKQPFMREIAAGFWEIINNRGRSAVTGWAFGGFIPGTSEIVHAFPIALTAASEAYDEAINNDLSIGQALALAAVSFVSESVTEGIELGNMKNAIAAGSKQAWKEFWLNRIPAGLSEMMGETLNDIIGNEFDALIDPNNGKRAKAIQEYIDAGYMQEDAEAMAIADEMKGLLHTALISFISPTLDIFGFIGGGMKSTLHYAKEVDNLRRIGDAKTTVRDLRNRDIKYFKSAKELEKRELTRDLKPFYSEEKKTTPKTETKAETKEETKTETKAEEVAPEATTTTETEDMLSEELPLPVEEATAEETPAETAQEEEQVEEEPKETPAQRAAREKVWQGVKKITPETIPVPEAIRVPEGAERDNEHRADTAMIGLDTAMDSEDPSAKILAIASVLKMPGDADSTIGMQAATALADKLGARNALIAMQYFVSRAGTQGVDLDLVRAGVRYAMVDGSQSRQVMDSTAYKKSTWGERVNMIAEAAMQDMKSAKTDFAMQEANHGFRVREAAKKVIAQSDVQERLDAADQKVATAQRKKNEATQRLQSQKDVESAKAEAVQSAAQEAAQNPSKQNTDRLTHAVNELDSQSKVTDEYEQSSKNAEQEHETANREAEQTKDEVMTEVRDQAEQMVAEEDQARADEEAAFKKALEDSGAIYTEEETEGITRDRNNSHFDYVDGKLYFYGDKYIDDDVRGKLEALGFTEKTLTDSETGEKMNVYELDRKITKVAADEIAKLNDLVNTRRDQLVRVRQERDEETGKTQEDQENAMIAETIDQEKLNPKEAQEKIEKTIENKEKVKMKLRDLSQPVSNSFGRIALGALERKLGIEIRQVDLGPVTPDGWTRGKYVHDEKTGETYIAVNQNMTLGQALVEAALHEITHAMKNTGTYAAYRDVVLESVFGGTGESVSLYDSNAKFRAKVDSTIQERLDANDPNFVGKTHEEQIAAAEEEIVADFARFNLAEKDVIQRMMDSGVAGKIRNALHNINQMMKNYFGNLKGEEREKAEYLRRAERLYQKALDQVAKNSEHPEGSQFSIMQIAQATNMTFNPETLQLFDKDGNEIDGVKRKVTPEMIQNTPVAMLINAGLSDVSPGVDENGNQIDSPRVAATKMMAGLMNMVARYKDSDLIWEIGATTLSSTFSALKSNSDPQYKTTVDFGTVCAKTQAIIDTLSQVMLDRVAEGKYGGLTREDIMKVYDAVNKAGLSVPCPVCYVFSRWMGVPSLLGQMSQYQHDYVVLGEDGKIDKKATQEKADAYIKNAEEKYGSAKAINNQKTKIQNKLVSLEEKRIALEKEMYGLKTDEEKAAKQKEIDSVLSQMTDLDKQLGEVSAYNWITQALCKKEKSGKFVVDDKFKLTPDEILFDLNRTGEFAGYEKNWNYRKTRGAGMGKSIMPYSGETIGDILYGVKKKGDRQSTIKNPWLNMNEKAAQKQLREAQLRAIKQNLVGGQRLQSTSDFRPEWGLDYIMSFLELQAAGSKVQMYTKVAEAIDFFASVGADVNLSIMGRGQGYHEATAEEIAQMSDEEKQASTVDGKIYVMDFSPVTGMDYSTARDYKNKYNNVQMILVGMNDTHIRLAMANKDIDFIIPWHSSGNSKDVLAGLIKSVGEKLDSSVDYTTTQTDMVKGTVKKYKDENGNTVEYTVPGKQTEDQKKLWDARMKLLTKGGKALTQEERETLMSNDYTRDLYKRFTEKGVDDDCYGVTLSKEQASQIFPYEYWDTTSTKENADINGKRFAEYCEAMGIVPRFSQFKDEKGYWKLLIDRPMYNNDGTYHQQQVIDVTQAKIGNLDDSGRLENSDLPTHAQAKYAPKDPRNPNYAEYTAAQKRAVETAEAAINTQYHDGSTEKNSVFGDMTEADMEVLLQAQEDYEGAVEREDMEAAQEDVDFVAKQFGYTLETFHGTGEYFNQFQLGQEGIHLGDRSQAEQVARMRYEGRSKESTYKWKKIRNSVGDMTAEQRENLIKSADELKSDIGADIPAFTGSISDTEAVTSYVDSIANQYEDENWTDAKLHMPTFDRKTGENVMRLYAKINNPLVINGDITTWSPINISDVLLARNNGETTVDAYRGPVDITGSDVSLSDEQVDTLKKIKSGEIKGDEAWSALSDVMDELGFDGIKYLNEYEGDKESEDNYSYLATRSSDVKLADPVTYDDDGNVIPLYERFNEDSQDIRYSTTGDELTDADLELLKKSKAVTPEEIEAYRKKTSRPLEGKNARWSSDEGPAERQFGGEDGMLSESDEIAQPVIDYVRKNNKYFPDTNEAQILRAVNWIRKNGTHKAEDGTVTHTDGYQESIAKVTGKSFDYRSADGQARMIATMAMAVAKNDVTAQVALVDAYNRQGTDLGRALQARKMFSMMTPAGRIASLQKLVDSLQEELQLKGSKTEIKLSDWIYQAAAYAETEEDFDAVQNAANAELATELPVNWKDKINSLRMLAMLMNPRTHIRNILGNMLFIPAVGISNKLAATGELLLTKKGDRTKTLSLALPKEIRDFAREDAVENKDALRGEAKYNDKSKIKMQQKVFGQGNGVVSQTLGKFVQTLIDINGGALEGEDWFFLKGHYRRALGGWMVSNGYTVEQVKANSELLQKGREYAIQEAQKATYRDYNELANKLNDFVRDPKTVWGKGGAFLLNAVLPFKKTPANILRRGLEYSPVGLVKSVSSDLIHMKQYLDYQKGKISVLPEGAMSPTQVISNFCSGLTGSGIMALGMILGRAGLVKCGLKDDDDEFDKLEGSQEYALEISIGGMDVSFTLDWAAPMCMPFFVGAAINDIKEKEGGYDAWDYANALFNIAEPITQLSMLDGLNSVFRTSQSEDTDTVTQILGKIASNYVTSFVPSTLGAIARSYDPIRRKSYVKSGEGSGIEGTVKYATEQVENKIPGLSQSNIPVRDAFGRAEESGLAERLIENFVSPGYFSAKKKDPVVEELRSIYKETGDASMIPKLPQKYFQAGGEKITLDAEQYDQLTVERGQTAYNLIQQLQQNEYYQQVSAQDKASMIKDVWTYATENAKYNINQNANVEAWALNSRTNPVQGIVNRNKSKVHDECVEGYKVGALQAIRDRDREALWTCVEALEELGVKNPESSVKKYVASEYKSAYIRAYQDNDTDVTNEIEDLLINSDLDFTDADFEKWITDSEKQVAEDEDED